MYLRYDEDPAAALAAVVVERCAGRLPDLSGVTVLTPGPGLAGPVRAALAEAGAAAGHPALLGPEVLPLDAWAAQRAGTAVAPALAPESRELLLFEALAAAPSLAGPGSRWQLAESLLGLFTQLGDAAAALPDDPEAFTAALRAAYGAPAHLDAPLSREARLVHELWQAWRTQLAASGTHDGPGARSVALGAALETLADHEHLVLLAPERPGAPAARVLAGLVAAGRLTVLVRGHGDGTAGTVPRALAGALGLPPPPAADGADAWIDAALPDEGERPPLAARARRWAGSAAPTAGWRHVAAADEEQEARAVALAAVAALQGDAARVVIATENRRLARRVRALLERFGLALADEGGWALSTTSAAAVVERWLECIEQDFDWRPLLDVLKSPFLPPAADTDRSGHDTAVHRLERDLVRHEGVARGLAAYRAALQARSRRLGRWSRAQRRTVHALLERMERAARPLQRLHDGRRHPPARHVAALRQSLERAGIDRCLAGDAAGERVRAVLARLGEAAAGRDVRLGWDDFRTWCGRALEQEHFVPPTAAGPVVLADLARAADLPCDRLVLAGADAEHLPGAPGGSPFFNDAVRAELGLPTWPERWRVQLHRFRRALGLAGSVVFTHARERGGEPLAPSPWVELLTTFHELAFGHALGDGGLAAAAAAFDAHHAAPLPPPTRQPRPPAPPERLPARLSASRHQELVACPYRFFAGSCLGLEPPEEIRAELQKADYGERLHRALQAFWAPVAGMPAPWDGPLEPGRRAAAVAHLERLIDAAFAGDLETHFAHRAWHLRARALAPALVDWAIERAARAAFDTAEVNAERTLPGGPTLRGRLDRVDRLAHGATAVVDYKAGRVPAAADLRSGEDVQLATYALVGDDVAHVAYLALERERCRETALEGEDLAALASAVEARLGDVWERLARGAPMPAWVNAGCTWCPMEGLCRRPAWMADAHAPGRRQSRA